jgi:hypothetical protein
MCPYRAGGRQCKAANRDGNRSVQRRAPGIEAPVDALTNEVTGKHEQTEHPGGVTPEVAARQR